MKKRIAWLMAIFVVPGMLISASQAHAGAGVSINLPGFGLSVGPGGVGLNIGLPWVVATAPVAAPAPVAVPEYGYPDDAYEPVAEEVPEFVMPPELGFYVAVGLPYDLFFYNNSYYICRGNIWYNSAYYNGPWTRVYYSNVPYVFNRFPFERIHHYRDTYYRHYRRYGAREGYNHFRPVRRHTYQTTSGRYMRNHTGLQNQTTRNRADYRIPNTNRQGSGSGYTSSRPATRMYGTSSASTRTFGNSPANRGRTVYYRPNGTTPNYGSRAVTRPAYTRSYRNGYDSTNKYPYAGQTGSNRGGAGRHANYRPNNDGKSGVGKTVYYRTNGSYRGNAGKGYSHVANRHAGFKRGWQGNPR
ncbi:MAG TPA: hypothetical protein PLI53_05035 [Geobacteraceae bacterium]|nr:hypothetical protein [Geobacteraceae bacterium]